MATAQQQPLLSRLELAEALGVSVRSVDRLVDEGLPHFRVRGQLRFRLEDVLEALRAKEVAQ